MLRLSLTCLGLRSILRSWLKLIFRVKVNVFMLRYVLLTLMFFEVKVKADV